MQSKNFFKNYFFKRQVYLVSFFLVILSPLEALALDWERLLHYRNGKSEIESQEFFLSPRGKRNSKEELEFFIKTVEREKKEDSFSKDSALCQFPLRYLYLIRENFLEGDESDLRNCKEMSSFFDKLGYGRVSVVFSSYFMGNPGSVFGHTLLKISKSEYISSANEDPLLSYGINYAATAGDERGFFYAVKGLLGFYKGEFSAIPYYYKVREYNDYESRDLWVYDLNLSERQKKDLVYHIWELGKAKDNYYFFNKNCSYHLLKSLEVVLPNSYKLSSHYSFFTIPSQTVKRIYNTPNLISQVHYRPSLKSRLDFKMNKLKKKKQKEAVRAVKKIHKGDGYKELNTLSLRQVDAAIDLYDYFYFKEYFVDNKKYLKQKRPLLIERSKRDNDISYNFAGAPPHQIHQASFWGVSHSYSENFRQISLDLRPAFHSYFEDPSGLMPFGEVVLAEVSLGYYENTQTKNNKFGLNSAKWVRASENSPVLPYKVPLSWSFELSSDRPLFNQFMVEHSAKLETGLSFSLKGLNFLYAVSFLKASFLDNSEDKFFHEEGLKFGVRLRLFNSLFILSSAEAFLRNSVEEDLRWRVNYGGSFGLQASLTKNWSLFLLHEERFESRRTTAALRRYF